MSVKALVRERVPQVSQVRATKEWEMFCYHGQGHALKAVVRTWAKAMEFVRLHLEDGHA